MPPRCRPLWTRRPRLHHSGVSFRAGSLARLGGQDLWSGDLTATAFATLLDSPARQQILRQILAGDSVVWVIAHTSAAADLAEADRIEKRLKFLENVASLPIQDPNDPDSQLGPGPPLQLRFTSLRVNRSEPSEALLLKMLAGPSGSIDPATTSFAAAVFGRGRVLGAWTLDELSDAQLEEASMFLVGRCSCRVKDQNPGWDLLMNVDWPTALSDASSLPSRTAETTQTAQRPDDAKRQTTSTPVTVTTASSQAPPPPTAPSFLTRLKLLPLTVALLLLAAAVLLFRKR